MLDKIIKGLGYVEYGVRFLDETIDRVIKVPVKYIENQFGIDRKFQAFYMVRFGLYLFGAVSGANSINNFFNFDEYISGQENNFLLFPDLTATAKLLSILAPLGEFFTYALFSSLFVTSLGDPNHRSFNGAIVQDPKVYSYNTLSGTIRPYLLATAATLIAHGFATNKPFLIAHSIASMPLIAAMYVAGNDPDGGIYDIISNSIKTIFSRPQLQSTLSNINY